LLFREKPAWNVSPLVQLTRDSGLTTDPVISRDGKLLAYASDRGGAGNLDIWVQHIPAERRTGCPTTPADDHEPDISPDSSEIIFRSERDGGGIYSVSSLGGDPRLLIKDAYVPRFSPDGSRIAYSLGQFWLRDLRGRIERLHAGHWIHAVVEGDLFVAGPAAWSPDGKYLVFVAAKHIVAPLYLWLCSADGGPVTQMSALPIAGENDLIGQIRTVSVRGLASS
jgi:Tol biopolymer transport system component